MAIHRVYSRSASAMSPRCSKASARSKWLRASRRDQPLVLAALVAATGEATRCSGPGDCARASDGCPSQATAATPTVTSRVAPAARAVVEKPRRARPAAHITAVNPSRIRRCGRGTDVADWVPNPMTARSFSARSRFFRCCLLPIILMMLGAACLEGAKNPVKSANGALAPGASEGTGKKGEGTFRVVFAGPQGEANEVSELSLVFSRPLRKLELAGAPTPAISITPAIAGRWLWVGSHALHFVPETPHLPGATAYVVTVPSELRALDGSTLGSAFHFDFTTPRPKLVDSEPSAGSRGLEPSTVFTLHFNQGIDPEKFHAQSKLSAVHAGKE